MKKDYILAKRLDKLKELYHAESSVTGSLVLGAKIDILEWVLTEE